MRDKWDNRSAIWGGATGGLIVGVVLGIIQGDFSNLLRAVAIGALIGLAAELLGMIGDRIGRE